MNVCERLEVGESVLLLDDEGRWNNHTARILTLAVEEDDIYIVEFDGGYASFHRSRIKKLF